jgi:GR25 family glycosyltransferase involved in LPS biosynthesis
MTYKNSFLKVGNFEVPIFIISLDDDHLRRNALNGFFSTEIVNNYFPASDMRSEKKNHLDELCDKPSLLENPIYERELSASELGCNLSHRRIYQNIVENSLPYAVIFEDDVLPLPNWSVVLNNAIEKINSFEAEQAILIHMGHPGFRSIARSRVAFVNSLGVSICPEIRIVKYKSDDVFWFSHAYIITLEAARRILETYPRISCMCDDWRNFYDHGCFDFVFLTECAFWQNFEFNSNLRLRHPLGVFNNKSSNLIKVFIADLKGLVRKVLDLLNFINPTRWVVINLKDISKSGVSHRGDEPERTQ